MRSAGLSREKPTKLCRDDMRVERIDRIGLELGNESESQRFALPPLLRRSSVGHGFEAASVMSIPLGRRQQRPRETGTASNGARADPGALTAGPACRFGCLDGNPRCSVVPS
jgi:hypothetical protein